MNEPSTALQRRPETPYSPIAVMTDDEINRTWRVASALAQAHVFKDMTQAAQAFAKVLLGRDLGLSPMQSMMGIDFVKGAAQIRGVTLLAFVRKHPDYDYKNLEHDEVKASIEFKRRVEGEWASEGVETYTVEQAQKANLIPADVRSPWHTARKNMLLWRCASNGVKFMCPDLLGGVPVYTEADSFVEIRDGDVEEIAPAAASSDDRAALRAIVRGLGAPEALQEELLKGIERLNELSPGAWGPARAQMTLVGQDASRLTEVLVQIHGDVEEAELRRETAFIDDPVQIDAEAIEDPELRCPVCGFPWEGHTDDEKRTCNAAADSADDSA